MDKLMGLLMVLALSAIAFGFTLFLGWLLDDERNNTKQHGHDIPDIVFHNVDDRGDRSDSVHDSEKKGV